MNSYTAAVVQWAPEVNNLSKGAEKAVAAIAEAAKAGAKLVVFPEVWLQGYLYWAGRAPIDPEYQYFRQGLWENTTTTDSADFNVIRKAAQAHKCTVVMSYHERTQGTIYASQAFIGADGRVLGNHRKLMPTMAERTVWGMGDGSDLDACDTALGRLGGMMCFEHQMAPARHACCHLGIEVHAAAWPGHAFLDGVIDASMRQLAHENACFVIVAREVMSVDRLPVGAPVAADSAGFYSGHGGSAIIAPGGKYIVEPVFDQETIIYGEIDLSRIGLAKWWMDGTGHYSRPDVFQMNWNRSPKPAVAVKE